MNKNKIEGVCSFMVAFKRVLLKLSGEAMAGDEKTGINAGTIDLICEKIVEIVKYLFHSFIILLFREI